MLSGLIIGLILLFHTSCDNIGALNLKCCVKKNNLIIDNEKSVLRAAVDPRSYFNNSQ